MTSFIISLIIGVAIVTGSIFHTNHVVRVSETLAECTTEIEELLQNENFDEAVYVVESLEKSLKENKALLESSGNHEELLKIELTCEELKTFTAEKSKTDALVQCASLRVLLKNMPKNYRVRAENIL